MFLNIANKFARKFAFGAERGGFEAARRLAQCTAGSVLDLPDQQKDAMVVAGQCLAHLEELEQYGEIVEGLIAIGGKFLHEAAVLHN
jgi:hypothetical protein